MSKKAWALGVVLVAGVGFYLTRSDAPTPERTPDELVNRIWIDALPTNPKQKVHVFLMVDEPQLGQFLHTSAFEGDFSLFEWHDRDNGRIDMTLLQSEKKHRVSAAVSSKGCEPFDFCLELKGAPRGAKKYYSMQDWVVEPGRSLDSADVRAFLSAHTTSIAR